MTEISQIFSNLSIIFKKYLYDLYRFERFGYAELKVLAVGDSKRLFAEQLSRTIRRTIYRKPPLGEVWRGLSLGGLEGASFFPLTILSFPKASFRTMMSLNPSASSNAFVSCPNRWLISKNSRPLGKSRVCAFWAMVR